MSDVIIETINEKHDEEHNRELDEPALDEHPKQAIKGQ